MSCKNWGLAPFHCIGPALVMSLLHVVSWGLLLGAIGQAALYKDLLPRIPTWMFLALLLPPWLTVYTISFCRRPPFGPRRFRSCLIIAMAWYAIATLLAETVYFIGKPIEHGHFPHGIARALIYVGALSCIIFVRACVGLRTQTRA